MIGTTTKLSTLATQLKRLAQHYLFKGAVTLFVCGMVGNGFANHTLAQLTQIEQKHTQQHVNTAPTSMISSETTSPQDKPIMALSKHYELMVFYLSTCPHCHRFLPIIKSFAQMAHIPLIAYTLDGKAMPGFPNSKVPPGKLVATLFPQGAMVPALYLRDRTDNHIFTVSIGEQTPSELLARMRAFAPKVLAFEEHKP